MKNALILHGTDNNSQGNWYPWLKDELIKLNYNVWVPDLPKANKPNIDNYNNYIFANKDWQFNNDSILIGHSSGAVAILYLLQNLPDNIKIKNCFLVSAFKDNLNWDALNELFLKPFDFEKIKKHANKFIFIHSDNDPYVPLEHAKFLSEKLDGKLIILEGQKHFNLEMGEQYKQFPKLLKIIKENTPL